MTCYVKVCQILFNHERNLEGTDKENAKVFL